MTIQCPKCNYVRGAQDAHLHPELCPACSIAYTKWLAKSFFGAFAIQPKIL